LHNLFHSKCISITQTHAILWRNRMSLLVTVLVISFVISALYTPQVFAQGESPSESDTTASDTTISTEPIATSSETTPTSPSVTGTILLDPAGDGAPSIDGTAYVLYDAQSGVFLLGSNQDTPLPPASITKVMTVLLALETMNLTDTIVITREMYESIPSDYQRLGLVEGEEITVEEAIYASLLMSACDASMALGIAMGGSVDGFSDMMNKRALELGCLQTNFTNPYGISDENHLTTAHDMALIMAAALKIDTYKKISTTSDYTMPATNKYSDSRYIENGNRFVTTTTYAYEYYIGGKTGFTDLSGHTIAAGAQKDGRTLVGVILGASGSTIRYANLISLFEYGFTTYNTSGVNPNDYSTLQQQTIDQVQSAITDAGYTLEITDTSLTLIPYCTTTSARVLGGYSTSIDVSLAVIQADLSQQTLTLPVYRQYADGSKDQVGSLNITLTAQNPPPTNPVIDKASLQPILMRVGIIILLLAILITSIIFFVILHRKNTKRRNHRNPRIL